VLDVIERGIVPYAEALELQREAARQRIAGTRLRDMLFLLEHPPVITLGRSAGTTHVVASKTHLASRGVEVVEVERGGDVTFHGPGQIVGYPILDLKRPPHRQDLHWYLRQLEQALIDALAEFGIEGGRRPKLTGVWVGDRKIASIGVHARDWVTWHGFALNVTTDLSYFDLIVPCGISGVEMTSMALELAPDTIDLVAVRKVVAESFGATFNLAIADYPDMSLRTAAITGSGVSPAIVSPSQKTISAGVFHGA
jgi:lipoyl(octanoyl) transferase